MEIWCYLFFLFGVTADILALPRQRNGEPQQQPDVTNGNRPSNSFYDHFMGNLQNSNRFVQLAMMPQGIAPPLEDDYDDTPIPQAHYAFINPALNGEKVPHWTETLQNFKNNPAIPAETKDKVLQSFNGPIKIYGAGTESRFPLLVEYFVQRIQNYFSHYVYEDMSRPASWNVSMSNNKPSSDKEPVTEDGKVESDSVAMLTAPDSTDDIDYIIDITLRPDIDEIPDVELKDEDFEKTTEEWEAPKEDEESKFNATDSSGVVVVKDTLDLKVVEPISIEKDSFLYVGDGNGDELLTRSNKRRLLKKKKRD